MPHTPLEVSTLDALRDRVTSRFGSRAKLVLFGSRARGEGHEESDLDVLVWLDDATSAERREVIDLAFEVEQAFGLAVSPLVRDSKAPLGAALAAEIARDGVTL